MNILFRYLFFICMGLLLVGCRIEYKIIDRLHYGEDNQLFITVIQNTESGEYLIKEDERLYLLSKDALKVNRLVFVKEWRIVEWK